MQPQEWEAASNKHRGFNVLRRVFICSRGYQADWSQTQVKKDQ
jgi:hypothetical protein